MNLVDRGAINCSGIEVERLTGKVAHRRIRAVRPRKHNSLSCSKRDGRGEKDEEKRERKKKGKGTMVDGFCVAGPDGCRVKACRDTHNQAFVLPPFLFLLLFYPFFPAVCNKVSCPRSILHSRFVAHVVSPLERKAPSRP
jgi:hypothetical protein